MNVVSACCVTELDAFRDGRRERGDVLAVSDNWPYGISANRYEKGFLIFVFFFSFVGFLETGNVVARFLGNLFGFRYRDCHKDLLEMGS